MSIDISGIDAGKLQAIFSKIDKDKDGKVGAGEIKEAGYEPSIFNIPKGKSWTFTQFSSAVTSKPDIQKALFGKESNEEQKTNSKQNEADNSIFDDPNAKNQQSQNKTATSTNQNEQHDNTKAKKHF